MPIKLDGPSIIDLGGTIINSDGIITSPIKDFEPVRHGHWEAVEYGDGTVRTECSVCGYGRGLPPVRNYCPNCGAKMDERKEDAETD